MTGWAQDSSAYGFADGNFPGAQHGAAPAYGDPAGGYGSMPVAPVGYGDGFGPPNHGALPHDGDYLHGATIAATAPYSLDAAAMLAHGMQQPMSYAFPMRTGLQGLDQQALRVVGHKLRIRWENVVPALAAVAFILAAVLFARDFDAIMGREAEVKPRAAAASPSRNADDTGAAKAAAVTMSATDLTAGLASVEKAIGVGDFAAADTALGPLLDAAADDPRVVAANDRLDAVQARHVALERRLGSEVQAARWSQVLRTLGEMEAIAPLTADQHGIMTNAQRGARADRSVRTVQALVNQGKLPEAAQAVKVALVATPDPRLRELKKRIADRMAPGTSVPAVTGAGAATVAPPSAAAPPRNAPAPPAVPNAKGGATTGGITAGGPPAGTAMPATGAPAPADHTGMDMPQ